MSEILSSKCSEVRGQAIGMLEAGKKQNNVAKDLEVGFRTVQRWWAQHNREGNMDKKKRTERLKVLGRNEKIIIR